MKKQALPKKGTVQRLLSYAGREKRQLVIVAVCAVVSCTLDIILPFYFGRAIDHMLGPGEVEFTDLLWIVGLLAALNLILTVFGRFMIWLPGVAANRMVGAIRRDAFDRISTYPLAYFDNHSHGDTVSRFVNDCEAVGEGLVQGITQLFQGVVVLIGSLAFMLAMSWQITLVVLAVTSLTFLVAGSVTRMCNKYFRAQQDLMGELTGVTEEMLDGQRTVRAFGYEERAQRQFDDTNKELRVQAKWAQFASALVNPTTRFVGHIAYISVGVLGGVLGGLSAGGITSFLTYSSRFARPFTELTAVMTQLLAALAAAERIFDMMDLPPEESDAGLPELTVSAGEVAFDDVSFSYVPEKPLVQHFSAVARPGMRVAIVGPTGAGKTTMVNLLMRFYDVDKGAIRIDGVDIRSVTRDSLHRQFGMVLQETWLFAGTIRDNIAYGRPEASFDEVVAAAKAAHAHGFIRRLPQGYDTVIADDGGNLSQGQKQLLTIARVMLLDPPILILDEATSSVDTLTEQRIQKAFHAMMQGRTSFVIAHRLSTIRDADLILYMQNGQILEQGNHEELLAQKGYYSKLYYSQFEATRGA